MQADGDMMKNKTPGVREDITNMTMTEPPTLEDRYPIPSGKTGIMHELCKQGDVPIMWNKNDLEEVALARKTFNDARKAGFTIFRSEGKDGHRGQAITEFDPDAQRLIMVRAHQGG